MDIRRITEYISIAYNRHDTGFFSIPLSLSGVMSFFVSFLSIFGMLTSSRLASMVYWCQSLAGGRSRGIYEGFFLN